MTTSFRLRVARSSMLVAATVLGSSVHLGADVCPVTTVASGLVAPMGVTQSNLGNLIVAETGTATPRTGRLSIVGKDGTRPDIPLRGGRSSRQSRPASPMPPSTSW